MRTERIFIKNLNANDVFALPGENTLYVCESRKSESPYTSVTYRVKGDGPGGRYSFAKVSMTTVDLVV